MGLSREGTWTLVVGVVGGLVVVYSLLPHETWGTSAHASGSGVAREPVAPAPSASADTERAEASAPVATSTNDPSVEAARAVLVKLSINPLAFKPNEVTQKSQEEPWTSYEYTLPGIGEVVETRWDAKRWAILVSGGASPDIFAPPTALKHLDRVDPAEWWRITAGPFAGAFVLRSANAIMVRSKPDVCDGDPTGTEWRARVLPYVSAECGKGMSVGPSPAPVVETDTPAANGTIAGRPRARGERCTRDCQCESLECKGFRCVTRDFDAHPLLDDGAACLFDGDCRSCDCAGGKCR
jgi:hypothetical protein